MESLRDFFIDSCLKQGEKRAITFLREGKVETEISYTEMNQDSNLMANTFIELGVEKGDRVILFLEKSLLFVIAHLALQKIGAIAVPLNPGFKKSEMKYFFHGPFCPRIDCALEGDIPMPPFRDRRLLVLKHHQCLD